MVHSWLHRYAVIVAVFTLLLVIAGGLVTSNDAALSIPDWPQSWGKLIPPLEGGIAATLISTSGEPILQPLVAATALFAQTILGAAVRHQLVGVMPHIAGAAAATVLVMWAALGILMRQMDNPSLRRPAMALLSLTFSQVFLGMGAYLSRVATAGAPQPMPLMIWFTVAHVAVGALAFGSAIILALVVYWHPSEPQMVHGGMAVA
jgi:heme A synthase